MINSLKPKKIIKTKLFPSNGDISIWDKVLIDDETVSYISLPEDAEKITKIIEEHCKNINIDPKEIVITDATAGAGGDVLSFSKSFKTVNAIEIDVKRYHFLTNNIDVYGIINVNHYCDNCLNLIFEIYHDVLFIDPPWGGKDYKDKDNLKLKISDQNIENICLKLMDNFHSKFVPKMIALKLPKNYDLKYLYDSLNKKNTKIILHNLSRMYLVIIYINYDHSSSLVS